MIDRNPTLRLRKPAGAQRVVKTLSHQHLDALFAACDCTTSLGFRDFVLMLVLLDTGIRVGELCGLTLDYVHDDHVRVIGKGSKEREVGISPVTAKHLWKYIHQHRVAADESATVLFTTFAGQPLTPSGVEKLLGRVKEEANITDVRVTAYKFSAYVRSHLA